MPRLRPTSPIGLALTAFEIWRRLPPRQRRRASASPARTARGSLRRCSPAGEPPAPAPRARERRRLSVASPAPRGRCGPARAGAPSGSPRSGSPATGGRRSEPGRRREPPPRAGGGSSATRPCSAAPPGPRRSPRARDTNADQLRGRLDRERVELLEPGHRDRRRRPRAPRGRRCRSRASRSRARAGASLHGPIDARVVEHRLEAALREVGERRGRLLEAQEPLRRHHDERPRRRVERLPAQQVEVLRRRSCSSRCGCSPARRAGGSARASRSSARGRCPRTRAAAAASGARSAPTSRGRRRGTGRRRSARR